jgi:aerobic carbon-monoxide dehydrogenase medium subunit
VKAVAFEYERPADIKAALSLLGEDGPVVKVLAGGQSLGPMLNLRLVRPEVLVDVTRIVDLKRVEEHADSIVVGACVTHADMEDLRVPDVTRGALPGVARAIAYRAVRNRGTVGGSLAHADPAADWVSALSLIGADVVVWSRKGSRTIAAQKLVMSSFTTALHADELIRAVRIPKLSSAARWGFFKFSQKAGEFAHTIGGVLHDPARGIFRAVIGAIETAPTVVEDARSLFGGNFDTGLANRIDHQAVVALLDAKNVTDDYIRGLAPVALKRAAMQACAS